MNLIDFLALIPFFLSILLEVGILLYSNLVYFCEREVYDTNGINCTNWEENLSLEQRAHIGSHPCYAWTYMESFWWGLMTMTTVGYDLYPKTFFGRLIGGFCALTGLFIL